jgi:hypothetical protein
MTLYVYNRSLKSEADVKKSFEDFYGAQELDLKNISNLIY